MEFGDFFSYLGNLQLLSMEFRQGACGNHDADCLTHLQSFRHPLRIECSAGATKITEVTEGVSNYIYIYIGEPKSFKCLEPLGLAYLHSIKLTIENYRYLSAKL